MKNIRNIIFDFGGVLYDIDVPAAISAFNNLGITKDIWTSDQDNLFNRIETGKIRISELISYLKKVVDEKVTEDQLLEAFHRVLVELPHETIDHLNIFHEKYRLFLLSNTNHAHFDKFEEEILSDPYTKDFFTFFEKQFYSFKMGLRKPDPEIYRQVLREAGIMPEETLFIDDNRDNIESASTLGIQVFLFEGEGAWKELHKLLWR